MCHCQTAVDAAEVECTHRAVWSERGHILLEAVYIHDRVGGNVFRIPRGKNVVPCGVYALGNCAGRDLEAVMNGKCPGGNEARINDKRRRASKKVILPDIGRNGGHPAARVDGEVARQLPRRLHARPPAFPLRAVARLRIDHVLLHAVDVGTAVRLARSVIGV